MFSQLKYVFLFSLPIFSVSAEPKYNFDEMTHVLQSEYQNQLKQNEYSKRRVPQVQRVVRPKPAAPRFVTPQPRQNYQQLATNKQPEPAMLFSAASGGNNQLISRLLQQGVDINAANSEGETALHMAAAHGHYSAVIYLMSHGANLHARTVKNWMPLHHAIRFRYPNIAHYLMQKGASPYARTSDGLSAIDIAKAVDDKRLLYVLGVR